VRRKRDETKPPPLRRIICSDDPRIEEIEEKPAMKIRSKQAVYLDASRKKAFPENHPEAAFLLVGAGSEIDESELAKYEGADKHVASEAKPYTTVTDSKVVAGKIVEGEKVKIDPSSTDAPSPAIPNENPANTETPAAASPEDSKPAKKAPRRARAKK
jgi:hypothetical protein